MFFDDFSGQTTFSASPDLQIRFCNDGMITYTDSMDLLKSTVDKRTQNRIPDTLLLLEHSPTYTLGMRGKIEHLLIPESELKTRNIDVHRADRGGDIT
ncbi:MAG: hypothetical protein KAH06_08025, partial [Desulfobacterales bacterium]|nr:hypothetical protein [Desulfobacterales bacterium]